MNQTQVNSFLQCLSHIDDENYIGLRTAGSADGVERAADTSDDSSQSHDILVAKIVALVVLFCATSFCGSIPFMLNRCFKWTDTNTNARTTTVVKCLLYFGGGVLLCTTFLHMLPEVEETVEQLQECGELPELYFSLSEMLMCGGFLLMFLIEELIHAFIHHKQKQRTSEQDKAREAFERGRSVRNSYLVKGKPTAPLDAAAPQLKQAPEVAVESAAGHSKATGMGLSAQDLIANDVDQQNYMQSQYSDNRESLDHHHMHHHHHHDHDHDHIHQHHHHHHDHAHGHGHSHMAAMGGDDETPDPVRSWLRGLLIVVALSLHEVFEGLAIGLETSSASAVWLMFGAVSAHKLVLAFCVSVELIVARTRPLLSVVYVITFAIVSPIGIAIGILVSHNEDTTASSIPSAILQGLACGTLLYVVFFEILSKNRAGLLAFLSLFVGFALMFGMQSLGGDDDHDHSCSSSITASTTASPADNSDIVRSSLGGFHDVHHGGHGHAGHSHHPPTVAHLEQQLKVLREASRKLIGSMKNQTEAM